MRLAHVARPLALLAVLLAAATSAMAQPDLSVLGRTASALAPDLPSGFYLEDAVDASFVAPVNAAFAPGGRMFVVEKRGLVWVVQNGVLQPEPFLDLRDEVLDQHDRGMLGIAIDPDFETNRRVYLSYTVDHQESADRERLDAYARVTRYAGQAGNPNRADHGSRRVLIGETFRTGIPSCYKSHTIGTLAFGADGTLLVGSGDGADYTRGDAGGSYAECFGADRLAASEDVGAFRSQRVESLAGKILRVSPETGLGVASNPFWTGDARDTASKVWALGLRNPFRFALDPTGASADPADGRPGRLYIGDVGWSEWEDLHVARGGENFGWPCIEGPDPHGVYQALRPATNGCGTGNAGRLTAPAMYWHHTDASRSSPAGRTSRTIVAGAVYRGTRYPSFYRGALFYGDYARGWVATARLDGQGEPSQERVFGTGVGPVVGYAYDPASGYLHLVDVVAGRVRRIRHTGEAQNAPPVAQASATPDQGGVGLRAQFSPAGSFDPDGDALTYSWAFGDGARSDERAPAHVYSRSGVYTAVLEVSDGVLVTRAERRVTVRRGRMPTVRITAPTAAVRGQTGQTVRLAAAVSDPDQSAASLFVRWSVVQIHDEHVHFNVFQAADAVAEFRVPEHGAPGEQVYYRVRAEVRDATGLTASDETTLFVAGDPGQADVTAQGSLIASVTRPRSGRGSTDLRVVADGVAPERGATDPGRQFSTWTGARARDADWVGLEFSQPQRFSRVTFQEGQHWPDGGWFESTPRVQVRQGGAWTDVVDAVASPAYRADDGVGFDTYQLSFAPSTGDAVRVIGPPGGSGGFVSVAELRAWSVSGAGGGGAVDAPWTSADVGTPSGAGSARQSGGTVIVTGGGDIWSDADRMHFVSQPLGGDGRIVARVASLSPEPEWAKAALMIRGSRDPDAPHASIVLSNIGAHVQARTAAGQASTAHGDDWGRRAPTWLRLDRQGDTFTGRVSDDGVEWQVVGTVRVPGLGRDALIGLAVSAADFGQGVTATAQFADVAVTGAPADGWTGRDVGTVTTAGRTAAVSGGLELTASGDIWSTADRMHLAYQVLPADGALVARVSTPQGPREWSKAGLMVRRDLEPGSAHAWFGLSQLGVHLQHRPRPGSATAGGVDDWGVSGPAWLRIERRGTRVTASRSADGRAWEPFGQVEVPGLGAGPVLIGPAVSAAEFGEPIVATGRFTDLRIDTDRATSQAASVVAEPLGFGIERIYPNPIRDRATLDVRVERDSRLAVELVDVLGRSLRRETFEAAAGVQSLSLDLSEMPAGVVLVRLTDLETGATDVRQASVVR